MKLKKGQVKYDQTRAHQNSARQFLYVDIEISLAHAFNSQPALSFKVENARIHHGSYAILADKINELAGLMISAQYLDDVPEVKG